MKNPLSIEELAELAKLGGVPMLALLNKRSKTYKEHGQELEELNELAVASFLEANPKAIIRPLVAGNNKLILGFKAETYHML